MKLTGFPMPPTSNKLYASVGGRFIKTVEGRRYDAAIAGFSLIKFRQIEKIKKELQANTLPYLHISTTFVFFKKRIVGTRGQLKRLDASNRIKQAHDALAKILSIDDSYFVQGSFSKIMCDDEKDEQVIIEIKEGKLHNLWEAV